MTTGGLSYRIRVDGVPSSDLLFVGIRRTPPADASWPGSPGRDGLVVYQLMRQQLAGSGVIDATFDDRRALRAGELSLVLHTRAEPRGAARLELRCLRRSAAPTWPC